MRSSDRWAGLRPGSLQSRAAQCSRSRGGAYAIGSGSGASTESDYTASYGATDGGLLFVDSAADTALYLGAATNADNSMLCKSCALPEGYSLYIPAGYRLAEAAFSGAGQVYAYHTAG